MKVAGLLLAGGQSSRYGKQKLLETFDGQPLFMKSIHAFREAGIDDIYVVTNTQLVSAFESLPVICEKLPHEGPLVALFEGMTALKENEYTHFQVLAGDLPAIRGEMISLLLDIAKKQPTADIILPKHRGKQQPLHAVYHLRCLPLLAKLLPKERRMSALYDLANTHETPFSHEAPYFLNINYQADWRNSNDRFFPL